MIEDLVRLQKRKDVTAEQQKNCLTGLARLLPSPIKALEHLQSFCVFMRKDPLLISQMEALLLPNATVKESVDICANILRKWGDKRPGYHILDKLFIRFSTTLVDRDSLQEMMSIITSRLETDGKSCFSNGISCDQPEKTDIDESMSNGNDVENSIGQLTKKISCEKGMRILTELVYVFSDVFKSSPTVLKQMVHLTSFKQPYVAVHLLQAFTIMGRARSLIQTHPDIVQVINIIWCNLHFH